jgi:hypothetical protein
MVRPTHVVRSRSPVSEESAGVRESPESAALPGRQESGAAPGYLELQECPESAALPGYLESAGFQESGECLEPAVALERRALAESP